MTTTVLIPESGLNGATPIVISGKIRKRVAHGKPTPLEDDELEVLRNSNIKFTIVGSASAPAQQDAGEAVSGDPASPEAPAEGEGNTLNVDPFDAVATLAQPIKKITEDMDEFSADQVSALIAAEKAAEKPRPTLVAALEKKLAALQPPAE